MTALPWVDVDPAQIAQDRRAQDLVANLLDRLPHEQLNNGRCRVLFDTAAEARNTAALLRAYGMPWCAVWVGPNPTGVAA